MNYSTEISIDLPRAEVLKKLTSVDNLKHWQAGFISAEHLSGELGQFGAKMKLQYKFGSRSMEMIETITKKIYLLIFIIAIQPAGCTTYSEIFFKRMRGA